jgi:hypothetical protein
MFCYPVRQEGWCLMAKVDDSILRMALVGFEAERQKVEEKISEIQRQLGGSASKHTGSSGGQKPKRTMSAAARRRIAAAQKKRWAAFHKGKAPGAVAKKAAVKKAAPKPKRKLSAAQRAALIANLKKARAARAAKRAAA